MKMLPKHIILVMLLTATLAATAQTPERGFYKDIYMDGGVNLTSKEYLPAARSLMLSIEKLRVGTKKLGVTEVDTLVQHRTFVGNEFDENGILLYPDGAPRYRMLFVNGGLATAHGRSQGKDGIDRVRAFVNAGGGYLGSCAGAYWATTGADEHPGNEWYLGIYPGECTDAHLQDTRVGLTIPANSPMLRYSDYGGDMHIDSIYHNGGCYVDKSKLIAGAEILFEYDYPPKSMHGNGAAWAYKANAATGRVICCGPHPESVVTGERLEMMEAMVQYVLEGTPAPAIKGELKPGEPRTMACRTSDNNPALTRIGDKQYHHFTVNVPQGTDTLKIMLEPHNGLSNYDMFLFASYDGPAMMGASKYRNMSRGVKKELEIVNPKPGTLFLSVFLDTTVDTEETQYGTTYKGHLDVLNGVPYVIKTECRNRP